MSFIHDEFLLHSEAAKRLFHDYAENEPILDYHCHLSPADLAADRRFANLFEPWLEGDHYKWRAMRANGVEERLCTGDADPKDKFLAWARTMPRTLRNPLYHWSCLELKRYFGIDELLDESNAESIWERANEQLAGDDLTAQGILKKFDVRAVCTTDDPTDDLAPHQALAASDCAAKVYPAFRPDKALRVDRPEAFNAWCDKLTAASNIEASSYQGFLDGIRQRHDFFHEIGGRLSDHGIDACFADFPSDAEAAQIFDKARSGQAATPDEHRRFASAMMLYFGRLDAEKGWTKQLHVGALRSVSTRMLAQVGPDTGFDSIGDFPQVVALGRYLDRLEQEDALPKMIIYNNSPVDNYAMATMMGNFQDGKTPGKMQFGSGWWYLDQKEAMEWQLNTLSNVGLLSRFVGMLTDSRSFMSYPRHEYFRRVLCNLLGTDIENGELPADYDLVGGMARDISFANARDYLGLRL